eukprot:CAMPEP_0203777144 /NCGR_PEP_ID=MMETSP0099_2-20121227/7214_1 /ASSEMBLY_ACC=CAM_ASM_000209 /TAXON_ID=96639 /ORGANISM=" , Strain NY0313808BC1" /LENGTH=493 /DNA_ID=CAMNT_0050676381 /DNA_START=366 /DNA_END=1847 /DNA_ORIENTATION=-
MASDSELGRVESLKKKVKELNQKEENSLKEALRLYEYGFSLLSLLFVVWILRSSGELSLEKRIALVIVTFSVALYVYKLKEEKVRNTHKLSLEFSREIDVLSQNLTKALEEQYELKKNVETLQRTQTFNPQPVTVNQGPARAKSMGSVRSAPPPRNRGLIKRIFSRGSRKKGSEPVLVETAVTSPSVVGAAVESPSIVEATVVDALPQLSDPVPVEKNVLSPLVLDEDDIVKVDTPDGMEALKKRVGHLLSPRLLLRYGGEVRFYERYLRARGMNVDKAEEMILNTLEFRKKYDLENEASGRTKERLETFDKFHGLWPGQFMKSTTFNGCVVQFFRFGDLNPKALMKQVTEAQFADIYITWMEKTLLLQNHANSRPFQANQEPQVFIGPKGYQWRKMVEIHDLSGISFSQLHLPGILMLNRVLKIGQNNYPENLECAHICNAPWFFTSAWKLISKVLDPATVARINIHGKVPEEQLGKLMSEECIKAMFYPEQ